MNQPGTSTGSIAVTTGVQKISGTGILVSLQCIAGSAAGTVTVYDGTSTAGLLLCSLNGVTSGTTQYANIAQGVVFNTGLFVVVSGTGAQGVIHYTLN